MQGCRAGQLWLDQESRSLLSSPYALKSTRASISIRKVCAAISLSKNTSAPNCSRTSLQRVLSVLPDRIMAADARSWDVIDEGPTSSLSRISQQFYSLPTCCHNGMTLRGISQGRTPAATTAAKRREPRPRCRLIQAHARTEYLGHVDDTSTRSAAAPATTRQSLPTRLLADLMVLV